MYKYTYIFMYILEFNNWMMNIIIVLGLYIKKVVKIGGNFQGKAEYQK